jgi:hypothetical protein
VGVIMTKDYEQMWKELKRMVKLDLKGCKVRKSERIKEHDYFRAAIEKSEECVFKYLQEAMTDLEKTGNLR